MGPTNAQVASPLNNLGRLYWTQGKYNEAESLCHKALHIREEALGPEHREVATSLDTLAELYGKQSKYSEAESLYQRALRIREQVLGPTHPDLAFSLNGLRIFIANKVSIMKQNPSTSVRWLSGTSF